LLQKSMEKKDKEVEELQRKVEKLNREVERLNRNREEMVTWSNSVVQELSTWGEAQATHLATKEDVMRRDFEKMFDEAMERRTRELAVMRKESRILTWFSLALEISKANNPNLRGKDNSTISLPDLEKEVSNVNKAKFRMKHGKFGTALCLARRC
jgi:FtsZ-binding cell division protein ZapB